MDAANQVKIGTERKRLQSASVTGALKLKSQNFIKNKIYFTIPDASKEYFVHEDKSQTEAYF